MPPPVSEQPNKENIETTHPSITRHGHVDGNNGEDGGGPLSSIKPSPTLRFLTSTAQDYGEADNGQKTTNQILTTDVALSSPIPATPRRTILKHPLNPTTTNTIRRTINNKLTDDNSITPRPHHHAQSHIRPKAKTTGHAAGTTSVAQNSSAHAARQARNLLLLKKSNLMLEKTLEQRQLYERLIEQKLDGLERDLKHTKDKTLSNVVGIISSSLFALLLLALIVANVWMFLPHANAIVMAFLVFAVLREHAQDALSVRVVLCRSYLVHVSHEKYRNTIIVAGMCLVMASFISFNLAIVTFLLCCFTVFVLVLLFRLPERHFTALVLVTLVTAIVAFPFLLALNSGAAEIANLAQIVTPLVRGDVDLVKQKVEEIPLLAWLLDIMGTSPDTVAMLLSSSSQSFFSMGFSAVSNASNFLWGYTIFLTLLFSLLQTSADFSTPSLVSAMQNFSPLPPQDNVEVFITVRSSTKDVLMGSLAVGGMHSVVTFSVLNLVGFPFCVLPAFASGALAVAPLFGTVVVWGPISVWMLATQSVGAMTMLISAELATTLLIEPRIVSHFPASSKFFGLPIVAGLFAWGPFGVIYGPLCVMLSLATARIYARYLELNASGPVTTSTDDDGDFVGEYCEQPNGSMAFHTSIMSSTSMLSTGRVDGEERSVLL